MGTLVLLVGPMYSGKSTHLIHRLDSLRKVLTGGRVVMYQSDKNERDAEIWSRNGLTLKAHKIQSLTDILQVRGAVVGVDELHMFNDNISESVQNINKMVELGKHVILSGLNRDYRGKPFEIVQALSELDCAEVWELTATCSKCGAFNANYTQILQVTELGRVPLTEGLPSVLSEEPGEDKSLVYEARCEKCFVGKDALVKPS